MLMLDTKPCATLVMTTTLIMLITISIVKRMVPPMSEECPATLANADRAYPSRRACSWSRGGGLDPEAMPPTLSHCWWEDTIFPKLFPRNKPGGVEWKVLKSSLQRSLQEVCVRVPAFHLCPRIVKEEPARQRVTWCPVRPSSPTTEQPTSWNDG